MNGCNFADDDVVISGMSIQLPAIDSLETFSTTLFNGLPLRPKVTEVIPDGYHGEFPKPAGKVAGANQLDAIFFGMNTATFLGTDRLQINALETSYVALMDAGINAIDAQNCLAQVYSSAAKGDGESGDYSRKTTRYMILGNCRALAANRVSFFMDMKGHSTALDVGDSGGMASLEMGWRDIKEGRCDMAVVTSGNLIVGENITASMNDLGWLCKSGNTRVFDNEADGFQRVECYATLILQRAKQAKRIYAKLKHVSCESILNVSTSSIRPSRSCWLQFLERTYADCGIDKEKIGYLEAYATGIKDWDTAELNAITDVFAYNRKTPLMVGSVKSNIGNAEGSADLLSIVKAIIALEHGKVPANRYYKTPNQAITGLLQGKLKVVDENWTLPEDTLIAVNSYSHGNLYGHCILEGFKKPKAASVQEIPRLAFLSARTDDLFPAIFHHIDEDVSYDNEFISLVHEIFKNDIPQHLARGYIVLSKENKAISSYQTFGGEERPIWFVFSGMGSQWPGMGRDLMKLPSARNSIQECHDILKSTAGLDLINILTADDPNMFNDNLNSFVGIAAVQIALVDILNVLKIVPDGIIGHSLGELGCAYADGSLTLEQTILAAYYRGKAVKDATLQRGAMAAIGRGFQQLKDEVPENVELVCHNSSTSTTISGLESPVLKYVDELQKRSIFAKVVEVGNIGFHSQFIAAAGPYLLNFMENVIKTPKLRSRKWISSSVPESDWDKQAALYSSAEYFTNNLLHFVLFEEACAHIPENAILIEIAPHGLLQAILKRSFPKGVNIPFTNRLAPDNLVFLLQAIGKLYLNGINSNIAALYPEPNFPVSRKTLSLNKLFPFRTIGKPEYIFINSQRVINLRYILKKTYRAIEEQIFRGEAVVPAALYANLFWYTYYQSNPSNLRKPFSIKNLRISEPFSLSLTADLTVENMLLHHCQNVEITKSGTLLANARISQSDEKIKTITPLSSDQNTLISLTREEFYNILREKGYCIPSAAQFLISIDLTDSRIRGKISKTQDWTVKLEALMQLVYFNACRHEERLLTIRSIGAIEVALTNADYGTNDNLDILYDITTNELACDGLYVEDVSYETHNKTCTLSVQTIVPYSQPPLKTTREFIEFCSQIISNLNVAETLRDIKVLNLQQGHLAKLIDAIETAFPNVKVDSKATVNGHKYDLVVCAKKQFEINSMVVDKFALARGFACKDVPPEDFAVVSSFVSDDGEQMTLLKRKIIVGLNEDKQVISIPERDGDLIATLKRKQKECTKLLLVGKSEPKDGIFNFIQRIQSHTSTVLRWVFILDDSAEEFSISNAFYKQQLQKDLYLNVFLNGSWNFVYKNEIFTEEFVQPETVEKTNPRSREIMGCGENLSWNVPTSWNIDNKNEVAAAFAMAYHCLIAQAKLKPVDIVLITEGNTVLGQACIAVALTKTSRVFTTVATEDEVNQLKTIYPKLKPENVLLHSDEDIIVKLKENINFPNIFISTLDGRIARDIFAYPPATTKIFHLGKKEIKENYDLLTRPFSNHVAIIAMDMDKIANWHNEDKIEVKQLVQEGLQNGVVQPLKAIGRKSSATYTGSQNMQRVGAILHGEKKFKIKPTSGSYFVLGDATGVDLDVAEWLMRRGAKHIVLLNTSQNYDRIYKKKLELLSLQWKTSLQTIDESSVETFLADVKFQSIRLEAAFYIQLTGQLTSPLLKTISDAVSSASPLSIAITQDRRLALQMIKCSNTNKSITSIVWNKSKELLVRNMDALSNIIGDRCYFSVEDEWPKHSYYSLLNDLIPGNIESIQLLGARLSDELKLIEMPNSGLSMDTCSPECQPVFFFPGVESDATEATQTLARGLLSPAFVVKIANHERMSIMQISTTLVSEILKVVDRIVYNLVGLSSGCVLAIEVARQLEQTGKVASLLLVDNPINILKQSYNTLDAQSIILDTFSAFSAQGGTELSHVVLAMELKPITEDWIIKGAKYINAYFTAICNYDVADLKLKGPLTVLRSSTFKDDDVTYHDICVDNYIVNSSLSHRNLLCSNDLRNTINKFIIVEDVAMKTIHEPLWVIFEDLMKQYRSLGKLGVDEKYVAY